MEPDFSSESLISFVQGFIETSTSPELTDRPEGTKIEDAVLSPTILPPPLPETVVKAPADATAITLVGFAEELGTEISQRVDTAQKELGPIGFGLLFLILILRAVF